MVDARTERNVVVVVFTAPSDSGWMLYYSGFKRAPVIHKPGGKKGAAPELAKDALRWLAHDLRDDSDPVGVRVISAATGLVLQGLDAHLMKPFVERTRPIIGEDAEVYAYLFSRSSNVSLPRVRTPMPVAGPTPIPVSADTVIAATDASFKSAADNGGVHVAGSGWVIEVLADAGTPVIETGSRHYAQPDEGHLNSANTFEMYAVRDALEHLSSIRDVMLSGVSRIVLYSDSTFVVRALVDRDSSSGMSTTVEQIHDLISHFAQNGIHVEYMWVKGHADNRWNLMAHKMADIGRSPQPG